jgi:hypothetical protein
MKASVRATHLIVERQVVITRYRRVDATLAASASTPFPVAHRRTVREMALNKRPAT